MKLNNIWGATDNYLDIQDWTAKTVITTILSRL